MSRSHGTAKRIAVAPGPRARPKRDLVQSVTRALGLLDTLASYPHGVTPKAIAAELGLNLSTVYHLLNTLVAAGYVVRAPDSGLFLLGPRVPYLHAAFLQGLVVPERLRDCVEALSRVTGETGLLFQWWGDQVMCSLLIEGTHAGHISGGYVGVVGPGHLMAVGQVLLAWAAHERVTAYLARSHRWPFDLPDRVDLPALRARLTAVRAAGYAVDRDSDGGAVCCVAAPIFGQGGQADHALG